MTTYATGKNAFGFCERCGLRYDIRDLKAETYKGNIKSNRVCGPCFDEDHPQNFLGTITVDDPQALRRPVPEIGTDAINAFSDVRSKPYGVYVATVIGIISVSTT